MMTFLAMSPHTELIFVLSVRTRFTPLDLHFLFCQNCGIEIAVNVEKCTMSTGEMSQSICWTHSRLSPTYGLIFSPHGYYVLAST